VVPLEIMRFGRAVSTHTDARLPRRHAAADEAFEHGLIETVTDPDRLFESAIAAAEALAALPAAAFALTKAQFREPFLQRMQAGASIDAEVQNVWASDRTLALVASTSLEPSRKA